jgi:hypothetical protein
VRALSNALRRRSIADQAQAALAEEAKAVSAP